MTLTTRLRRVHCPLNKFISRLTRTRARHTDTDTDHTEVLHILADDRRRYAIEYLADQPVGERVSLSDLADVVASRENDCSIQEISSNQHKRAYISLYQQHCSALSEVVDVDLKRKTLETTVKTKRVWAAYCSFCEELTG